MRKTKDDIEHFYDYDIMIPTGTLYLGSVSDTDGQESGTNYETSERIIKGLHVLDSKSDSPITIIVNNPGGDVEHGMAIYDSIKLCQNHITIKVRGMAYSMAGIILQSADERLISPNSYFMMHYGSMSIEANSKDVQSWVNSNEKFNETMENIFLNRIKEKHPKFTKKRLRDMLKVDLILNAKETVELGLADRIEGE